MKAVRSFDKLVTRWVGEVPRGAEPLFRLITRFGALTITLTVILISSYLLWSSDEGSDSFRDSGGLLLLFFGAGMSLKMITRRQRPDTIFVKSMRFKRFSFPSGHAYGSFLAYGFLAFLAVNWWAYSLATILIFLVGLSRLYLGAHFPSDVIGGWLMGGAALAVVITYANHI